MKCKLCGKTLNYMNKGTLCYMCRRKKKLGTSGKPIHWGYDCSHWLNKEER